MNTQDIEKIIKIFEAANVSHLDLEVDNIKIKLDKKEGFTPVLVSQATEIKNNDVVSNNDDEGEYVTSPLVGTYYQAASATAKPFVSLGSMVKKGDKLCIIEAMKVMNEIVAPKDGVIKKILAENDKMVEFGQKLFLIGD